MGKIPRAKRSIEHFEAHLGHTAGGDAELLGGSVGQIDDAAAVEGTAIIDPHDSGAPIPEVGDAHAGAEGKGAMGCGESAGTEDLATGGAVSVEAGAIPAGLTNADTSGCDLLPLGEGGRGNLPDEPLLPGGSGIRLEDGHGGRGVRGEAASGGRGDKASAGDQEGGGAQEMRSTHNRRNKPATGSCGLGQTRARMNFVMV